jgi:hypothetical protein
MFNLDRARQIASNRCIVFLACALAMSGCGGGSRSGFVNTTISVYLPISTVTILAGGRSTSVPVQIKSTSETALVAVGGLPAGVQVDYAATDTNPSGSLTFSAIASAKLGTYMPIVNVQSANQSTSTTFTLIVKASQ